MVYRGTPRPGILAGVAAELHVPEAAITDLDPDAPQRERGAWRRYLGSLERATVGEGMPMSDIDLVEARHRSQTEDFLARATVHGGVILGRGGAVALQTVSQALHVRLTGTRAGRVHQAMRLEGIDRHTAEQRREVNARAQQGYLRRAYGVDGENTDTYHMQLRQHSAHPRHLRRPRRGGDARPHHHRPGGGAPAGTRMTDTAPAAPASRLRTVQYLGYAGGDAANNLTFTCRS
ncbi:cytidylate kinase family protein [Dactylosporangium sp. NPDC005555]|uniref:cytidylate kinase family protein n=1 Tax=Dactylosporangium sp. NPDC005555 TaxID=3154889 RepID=UPI0033BA2EB6